MTLRDVRRFSDWLKTENASHLGTETGIIEPFYPHDFLKANELANLLFLKGTEDEVERLVAHEYNRGQRIYLRHYLDTDGSNATVPDAKMSVFVRECLKQRGLIEFTPHQQYRGQRQGANHQWTVCGTRGDSDTRTTVARQHKPRP